MSNTAKAVIGIVLAAMFTVFFEQLFENINFFGGKETPKSAKIDTKNTNNDDILSNSSLYDVELPEEEEIVTDEKPADNLPVNDLIRLDKSLKSAKQQEQLAYRIEQKSKTVSDKNIKSIIIDTQIPNYERFIDAKVIFKDDRIIKEILFLIVEGTNKRTNESRKNYFEAREGFNVLRLPNKMGNGQIDVKVSYILKKEASQKQVPQYAAFSSTIVE